MSKRKWLLAAGLVAVFAAVGLGYQGISLFLEAQYWETKMGHGEGKLRVGDMAPDFELQYKKSEETVRLSAFRAAVPHPISLRVGNH